MKLPGRHRGTQLTESRMGLDLSESQTPCSFLVYSRNLPPASSEGHDWPICLRLIPVLFRCTSATPPRAPRAKTGGPKRYKGKSTVSLHPASSLYRAHLPAVHRTYKHGRALASRAKSGPAIQGKIHRQSSLYRARLPAAHRTHKHEITSVKVPLLKQLLTKYSYLIASPSTEPFALYRNLKIGFRANIT